jgi:glyoxylase-like metal-dependent hydrolase (beta-lactamase superfamily II)
LHFDHCSNIDLFIDIPIYVSESELKSLDKTEDINTYSPLKYFKDRLNFLFLSNGMNVLPNVTAIHTPGHTAGHFSLSFNNDDKRIIVAGDAVKSAKEYKTREQIVPPMDIFAHKTTMEFIKNSFDIIIPGHQGPFIVDEPIDKDIILSYF